LTHRIGSFARYLYLEKNDNSILNTLVSINIGLFKAFKAEIFEILDELPKYQRSLFRGAAIRGQWLSGDKIKKTPLI